LLSTSSSSKRDRTPFIGREQERLRLVDEIARGAGLITISGPSGIGKSRLARQVSADVFDAFANGGGTAFCTLSGCRSEGELVAAVARALEVPQESADALAGAIANRGPMLLLLDNADTISGEGAAVLGRWMERCIELQMIVTSLAPLGIQGEILEELRPLDTGDAVRLYVDRAQRAWADRSFSAAEESEIEELVRRLDRIPLAIELAAARVRILSPRALLSMFEQRFDLLGNSATHRGGSLLDALQLTWRQLAPEEQAILALASVFEGGFSAAAASEVLGAEGPEPHATSPAALLDGLRRKSLIVSDEEATPRFQLLESVQEFARAELERRGGWEEAIRRHATFFLEEATAQARRAEGTAQAEHTRWLREERRNLIAIHQRFRERNPALSARAILSLSPLILAEGHPPSEDHLTQGALEAARESGESELVLKVLTHLGEVLFQHGRFEEAEQVLHEALGLAGELGRSEEEGLILGALSILHLERGDVDRCRPFLDRAVALIGEVDSCRLEAAITTTLGIEALERHALEEAEAHFLRSVERYRQVGRSLGAAKALSNLGLTLARQGRLGEARTALQESVALSRNNAHRTLEAYLLVQLAELGLAAGLLAEAEADCNRALQMQRQLGNRFWEAVALFDLGMLALERGELDLAGDRLVQAEGIFLRCEGNASRAGLLLFLAVLDARRGHLAEAKPTLAEARASFQASADRAGLLRADGVQAILDVVEARGLRGTEPARAGELVRSARRRLASLQESPPATTSHLLPVVRRLLEQELDRWMSKNETTSGETGSTLLLVGRETSWFEVGGSPRVDLRHRGAIRRIFNALVDLRIAEPGATIDPFALIEIGWPGAQLHPETSIKRLYFAIWTLRDLGLRKILLNQSDGYLLDHRIPIDRRSEASD